MPKKTRYVYVMQCKNYVKFGVSVNPESRIKELQTGNPFKITLLLKINYGYSFNIEANIHKYFGEQRGIGEWFEIDNKVKEFVKYLKNIEYNIGEK